MAQQWAMVRRAERGEAEAWDEMARQFADRHQFGPVSGAADMEDFFEGMAESTEEDGRSTFARFERAWRRMARAFFHDDECTGVHDGWVGFWTD